MYPSVHSTPFFPISAHLSSLFQVARCAHALPQGHEQTPPDHHWAVVTPVLLYWPVAFYPLSFVSGSAQQCNSLAMFLHPPELLSVTQSLSKFRWVTDAFSPPLPFVSRIKISGFHPTS